MFTSFFFKGRESIAKKTATFAVLNHSPAAGSIHLPQ
jgi:hypothetical protein